MKRKAHVTSHRRLWLIMDLLFNILVITNRHIVFFVFNDTNFILSGQQIPIQQKQLPLLNWLCWKKPKIKKRKLNYLKHKNENPNEHLPTDLLVSNFDLKPLFKNQEHINLIKDAMFSSSNEPGGTSYRHRIENPKFTFAGKTGSSQIKRFTESEPCLRTNVKI